MTNVVGSPAPAGHPQPQPSTTDFTALLLRFESAIERSARRHLRKFCNSAADLEDLRQVGRIALFRASKAYDQAEGPFEHYAHRAIANAVLREAQQEDQHWCPAQRVDLNEDDEESDDRLAELAGADASPEFESSFEQLRGFIRLMSRQQQVVFDQHFVNGLTQREVADLLFVSQQRVARIRSDILTVVESHLGVRIH
jgi:RNA polymerase sigma factor (sigma-70 family)